MLCKSDKPSIIIIITIKAVGGMLLGVSGLFYLYTIKAGMPCIIIIKLLASFDGPIISLLWCLLLLFISDVT